VLRGRLFFGLVGSRWHARTIVAAMIAALFIGVLLFAQPWLNWLFLPALPLIGFACAPLFPLFVSLTASVVGREAASRTIGMQVGLPPVWAERWCRFSSAFRWNSCRSKRSADSPCCWWQILL